MEPVAHELLLLIDTCGDRGSIALAREGSEHRKEIWLPERAASAGLLTGIREVLGDVLPSDLTGVGVVSGPGSFTGVRVGLAVAKGLCLAWSVRLATVSRLAVLAATAGLQDGFAVLRAGREQVYARDVRPQREPVERLMSLPDLLSKCSGREMAYAEPALLPLLEGAHAERKFVELRATHAAELVRQCLAAGGTDLALADANYVRDEGAIYARQRTLD